MIDLIQFNPWWQSGSVPAALTGRKRRLLDVLLRDVDLRQIQILSGIRRAGKTTLLFQVIQSLLNQSAVKPHNILYFSFDEEIESIEEIVGSYQELVLKEDLSRVERVYFFLDEIQKLPDWPDKIKVLYDLHPNLKIFLSGSSAIHLKRGTRESLAGRYFDVHVDPLRFDEYLDFIGESIDIEHEDLNVKALRWLMTRYLYTGGFIETFDFDDRQRLQYFKESLLGRVIYQDLPVSYAIRSPDLLYRLIRVIADRPGLYLEYSNLGSDLGFDQRTIADYISYLENALLVQRVYSYTPSLLTSEKKMKRAYLSSPAFTLAMSTGIDFGVVVEQYYVNSLGARLFWRTPKKVEVDAVLLQDDKVVPVEVKIRKDFRKKHTAPVFAFMKKYDLNLGYLISDSMDTVISEDNRRVRVIPYWKYWTLTNELGERTGRAW